MNGSLAIRRRARRGGGWRSLLFVGALVAGALVWAQLPEIRRYLRMRRM